MTFQIENWKDLKIHSAATMLPEMTGSEFDSLKTSLAENGFLAEFPVCLYRGQVLDGRHRLKACIELGLAPFFINVENDSDPFEYVASIFSARRDITDQLQKAFIVKQLLDLSDKAGQLKQQIHKAANQARSELAKGNQHAVKNRGVTDGAQLFHGTHKPNRTSDSMGALLGVSGKTYDRLRVIETEAPDLTRSILEGKMKATQALQIAETRRKTRQLEALDVIQLKAAEGVYDIVICDPPWAIEQIQRSKTPEDPKCLDYRTMSLDEISSLNLPAAENCHLWLWTTYRFLPDALRIIETWGFRYVMPFVWHKPGAFQPFGMPQHNAGYALYGRRGNPEFTNFKDFKTCFEAPRGSHSEKPETFYDLVRSHTAGRRLDMFNRRPLEGFDGWGLESPERAEAV